MLAPPRTHFRTLDFLRGTAALCVVCLHWFDGVGYPWFRNAGLAVDFFFLLSGFVIAYSYEDKLRTTMSSRRFLWLRFVRLYPMILAAVVLGMLRHVLHNALLPSTAAWPNYLEAGIAGLFMLPVLHITPLTPQPLVAGSAFPLDMVLWSLFYEGVANIAYALFIKKLKAPTLSAVIIAGWLGLVVTHLPALNATHLVSIFSAASFRVIFSFFLGVALFRLKSTWPKISAGPLALSTVLITIAAIPLQSAVFDLLIITAVLPLVVVLGANNRQSPRLHQTSLLLGDLSYPVYVLQIPLMWTFTGALKSLHLYNRIPRIPLGFLVISTICAASWIALKFYDLPTRQWLSKRYPQKAAPPLASSQAA